MVFTNKLTELFEIEWALKSEQSNTLAYRKRAFLDTSSPQITVADKRGIVVEILYGYYLLLERLSVWNEHQVKSLCKLVPVVLCSVEFMIVDCTKEEVDFFVAKDATFQCEEKLCEQVWLIQSDLEYVGLPVSLGVLADFDFVYLAHYVVPELTIKLGQPLEV